MRVVVTPRIAAGSNRTIASSRCRSGHSTALITAPSAATLKMPFAKFAAACLPNTRLAPASGDILLSFGFSCSPDHTNRCCTMLPAIAAISSSNSGTPSAAISTNSRCCASASRLAPSARIIQELATRLRKGAVMPPPIDPEKVESTSVAPAIMNQVLTSWLLATSPRSCASSRRFWVWASVFSAGSCSSAIASAPRDQFVHDGDEIVEEGAHHGGEHRGEDQKARENSQRHADEIHLHLRHQPRQHAKPHVEDEAEHQERRRQLRTDPKRRGKRPGRQRRDVAARHQFAGREDRVAVIQSGDHQVMGVGGEQQRQPEDGEEVADQQPLLALRRIDRG